jgi:hypothetical protein
MTTIPSRRRTKVSRKGAKDAKDGFRGKKAQEKHHGVTEITERPQPKMDDKGLNRGWH